MEILEQAFKSYLKNVEGCTIVQTNWTPSPIQLESIDVNQEKKIIKIIKETKHDVPSLDIFKKNSSLQFIRQCEIDVVGVKSGGIRSKVYLFDTAFHKNGLNYKDTPATVIKKLIRAAIIGDLFFQGYDIRVGFLSPKCAPDKLKIIQNNIPAIDNVLRNNGIPVTIDVYTGSQFDVVLNDLTALSPYINDNDDIFIRAVQLLDLAKQSANPSATKTAKSPKVSASTANPIGNKQIIISCVEDLINRGKIDSAMLANLCDLSYSRATFHVSSFPFFQEASTISAVDQNRFYPQLFFPANNGIAYRVTNQWYANKNIQYFQAWYNSVK